MPTLGSIGRDSSPRAVQQSLAADRPIACFSSFFAAVRLDAARGRRPQTKAIGVGDPAEQAIKALDQTVTEFNGDAQSIYLAGLSLDGYGSWYLAVKYPKKFAAVVPVSGGVVTPSVQPLPALKLLMPDEVWKRVQAARREVW